MRPSVQALLLFTSFTASACTAILVPDPNGGDDGVIRCNNTDDCPVLDDNRHVSVCVYGEDQDEMSSKVCVADYREINCKPENYDMTHPFVDAYDEAVDDDSFGSYVGCTVENLGKQGCGVSADVPCAAGLSLNDADICDDDDPNTLPAISPTKVPDDIEAAGQDVADQFCRWRFGDENWVCDTTGSQGKWICRDCDPTEEFGKGGCGTLYLQGAPSTVYTDLADANDGTKPDTEVTFGLIP